MSDGEGVAKYLTRISQGRNELVPIGEYVPDFELVRTALKGFIEEWKLFIKGKITQEMLSDWNRFWDDFI